MPVDFPLILRALRKHKIIAALVAIQIAIACAIIGNGLNLLSQRFVLQNLPTGLAEERLLVLDVETMQGRLDETRRDEVVAGIAAYPGVAGVSYVNSLPFGGVASAYEIVHENGSAYPSRSNAYLYYGDVDFLRVLGIRFVSGSGFEPLDFAGEGPDPLASSKKIVLSQSMARRLSASVGTLLQVQGQGMTVVGIVEDVMPPSLASPEDVGRVAFIPSRPVGVLSSKIVVNAEPGRLDAVMAGVVDVASRSTPSDFIWTARRLSDIRAEYFAMDILIARIVTAFMAMLGLIVAGGVGGLSSYWIQRRYKQIATRRALGARKADIAWYFHVENLVVSLAGAVAGLLGAVALAALLQHWVALPPMPILPPLLGGLLMIVVGQLAVYVPVRKALLVEPATLRGC